MAFDAVPFEKGSDRDGSEGYAAEKREERQKTKHGGSATTRGMRCSIAGLQPSETRGGMKTEALLDLCVKLFQ